MLRTFVLMLSILIVFTQIDSNVYGADVKHSVKIEDLKNYKIGEIERGETWPVCLISVDPIKDNALVNQFDIQICRFVPLEEWAPDKIKGKGGKYFANNGYGLFYLTKERLPEGREYYKALFPEFSNEIKEKLNNETDYACYWVYKPLGKKNNPKCLLILEWPDAEVHVEPVDPVNKEQLNTAIAEAADIEKNSSQYYTENDRYNGKEFRYYIQRGKTNFLNEGFWFEFQKALKEARTVNNDADTVQAKVDEAYEKLTKSQKRLIPKSQVNATELYEYLSPLQWANPEWNGIPKVISSEREYDVPNIAHMDEWGNIITGSRRRVNKETTIAESWNAYVKEKKKAQTTFDKLFDAEGNPTDENTENMKAEVEERTTALRECILSMIPKKEYDRLYKKYMDNRVEALEILEKYDPSKLNKTDYSEESWKAFEDAYSALKNTMQYKIVGETGKDFIVLKAFYGEEHYWDGNEYIPITQSLALKKAFSQLATTKDITVEFTYVNNFTAKFPQIRKNGTDVRRLPEMKLSEGNTTLDAAIDNAWLKFDCETSSVTGLPMAGGEWDKASKEALLAVFINGESYGTIPYNSLSSPERKIQLHEGDKVVVARIQTPREQVEASSGYDSSQIITSFSIAEANYRESFSLIKLTAPEKVTVGDKVNLRTEVVSAGLKTQGTKRSPKGLGLFLTEPKEQEDDLILTPLDKKAVETVDENGELVYTFTEPGYYNVGIFPVKEDKFTFTDIYRERTMGEYYSLYAGDFKTVYVEPAKDEKTLMKKYHAEYEAKAKAYAEKYHEYDFKEGEYETKFKAQYDKLISDLEKAENFKALKEGFDENLKKLMEYGETAIDHEGLIKELRKNLSYIPEDFAKMDESYSELVEKIQNSYSELNEYQKTLLTPVELTKLDSLAEIKTSELTKRKEINVKIKDAAGMEQEEREVLHWSVGYGQNVGGNVYRGRPELTWVSRVRPDGTLDEPREDYRSYSPGYTLLTGEIANIRLYCPSEREGSFGKRNDKYYWPVASLDGGPWTPLEKRALGDYPGYFFFEHKVPMDQKEDIEISLKMFSKEEYEAYLEKYESLTDSERELAIKNLKAEYGSYDLSKYSAAQKQALKKALDEGIAALNQAKTKTQASEARQAAIAGMAVAAVKTPAGTSDPGAFDSGNIVGTVHLTMENTTYKKGPFYGKAGIIDGDYPLGENDTMMTVILKALRQKGYTWNGTTGGVGGHDQASDYTITYLAQIAKDGKELAEFTGGRKSGWMGTLNDWFTNKGFQEFSVANKALSNGDEIHIMYTLDYGVDIGGSWDNHNTLLKSLRITGGTLNPATIDKNTRNLTLMIKGETASIKVISEAYNKNYQVRTFLNGYNKDSTFYKRSENITVKSGDVIYVGVGEDGWPTMNTTSVGTKYTIKVVNASDVKSIVDLINKLGNVTYSNYAGKKETVKAAKDAFDGLSKSDKEAVTNSDDLMAAVEAVKKYSQIDKAKALLDDIPRVDKLTKADQYKVMWAKAAYDQLDDEQKRYITGRDTEKYNAAVEWLSKQGFSIPSIEASDILPEDPGQPEKVVTYGKDHTFITVTPVDAKKTGDSTIITVAEENAEAMVSQAKRNKSQEISLYAKNVEADSIKTELPKKVVENILKDTKADVVIKLPEAQVKLDQASLKEIVKEAKGDKITVEVVKAKATEEQKKLTGESADVFNLIVKSNDQPIHNFGTGKVTVRKLIPERLNGKRVAAVYIPEKGALEVMSGKTIQIDKENYYEFMTSHFSNFALVDADEAGIETTETLPKDQVKEMVKSMKLKARTQPLKKSIKVRVKADKEMIKRLKDSGYTIKYKFYRSEKKRTYKGMFRKTTSTYTNTKLKRGKMYYYKAKIEVYDGEGAKVIATSLKNCRYGNRALGKKSA